MKKINHCAIITKNMGKGHVCLAKNVLLKAYLHNFSPTEEK